MTWDRRVADANWIQLGYMAANAASLLAPLSRGTNVTVGERDRGQLRQAADFFGAAVAGLSSLEDPSLLFHTKEPTLTPHPASALEIAVATYADTRGGWAADPLAFKADLESHEHVLEQLIEGSAPQKTGTVLLLSFLEALVNRARGEIQLSQHHSR